MNVLAIAFTGFVLAINVVATVALLRSCVASRKQRLAQLGIVWLVPLLGAVLIGFFCYSIRRNDAPNMTSLRNDQEYPGVNLYPPHGPSDT